MAEQRRHEDQSQENAGLRKETSVLQAKCDQLTHQYHVETSDKELTHLKERNDWLIQNEQLVRQVAAQQRDLDESRHARADLTEQLAQAERDAVQRIRLAKEEEWSMTRSVELEKRQERCRWCSTSLD